MKKITSLLFVLAATLLFSACDKDPVTYRFEKDDEAKLLPHYTVGKILTFRNELGEERKFEVSKSEKKIMQDWVNVGMGGVSDHYYFFYELKNILISDILSHDKFLAITLWQFPTDQEKARNNIYKKYESHLIERIGDKPFHFDQNQISWNIDDITYDNVVKFQRTNFSTSEYLFYEIIIFYYDIYQGLIEFQDINDHQWKLVNE
jgi:hypothetical protein